MNTMDKHITTFHPPLKTLFFSFLKLGATAFGGVSIVEYLRDYVVERKGWLDDDDFMNGVVLCQMIPGAFTMLVATYLGLKMRGRIGALVSLIGFGLPAFCMMVLLAALYTHQQGLPILTTIMGGLQAIIIAIIANAMLSFGRDILRGWKDFLIACLSAGLYGVNVSPILVILVAALSGLVLYRPKGIGKLRISSPGTSQLPIAFILLAVLLAGLGLFLLFWFDRTLYDLAVAMMKISLFSFGGGFAAAPLMLHEVVEVHGWMDTHTFMNGIILGQVTPGPVIITATFVGYVLDGLFGAEIATISIFLPSFLILVIITPYFDLLRASPYFTTIINSILCSFVGLLLTLTIHFALDVHWDIAHILLAVGALTALLRKVDILWVVLAGTLISALLYFV